MIQQTISSLVPPPVPRRRGSAAAWALGLLLVAGLVTLYFFEPHGQPFYPRCALYATTGLACPGCGGLRAAHQVLHGNLGAAFALNPLLFLLLPAVAGILLNQAGRKFFDRPWAPLFQHRAWLWLLVAALVVFTLVRNLPMLAHLLSPVFGETLG